MASASSLQFLRFAYLSQPAHERKIYRAIRRTQPKSIVEIGVGMAVRSSRIIQVAQRFAGDAQVRFTGIDLFEARDSEQPGLPLKEVHKVLTSLDAKVQVVPGDPYSALARSANTLRGTDIIVIGRDQDEESLQRAWFYFPRMLHEKSRVFVEGEGRNGKLKFNELELEAVQELAQVEKSKAA